MSTTMDELVEANPSSSSSPSPSPSSSPGRGREEGLKREEEDHEGGGGGGAALHFEDRARAAQYPTFIGKHKLAASISHLHNQIDIIQKELTQLETVGESSIVCKELIASVESSSDPLLPSTKGPADVGWDRWFRGSPQLKKSQSLDLKTCSLSSKSVFSFFYALSSNRRFCFWCTFFDHDLNNLLGRT